MKRVVVCLAAGALALAAPSTAVAHHGTTKSNACVGLVIAAFHSNNTLLVEHHCSPA